jgi:alcohol dehydrogenase (cytochrome c)
MTCARSGLAALLTIVAFQPLAGQRTPAAPARAGPPAGEWQGPGRDPALTRFSPLEQINAGNVAGLRPVWSFSTGALRAHEGSPLSWLTLFVHTPYPECGVRTDLSLPGAPIKWRYAGPELRGASDANGCCDGKPRPAYHPSGRLFVPLLTELRRWRQRPGGKSGG